MITLFGGLPVSWFFPSKRPDREKEILTANVKLVKNLEHIAMGGAGSAPHGGPARKARQAPASVGKSPRELREEALARRRQRRLQEIQDENEVSGPGHLWAWVVGAERH